MNAERTASNSPSPLDPGATLATPRAAAEAAIHRNGAAARAPFARPLAHAGRPNAPEHDARALTQGGGEARILLDGVAYVLRITRLGKLILTK